MRLRPHIFIYVSHQIPALIIHDYVYTTRPKYQLKVGIQIHRLMLALFSDPPMASVAESTENEATLIFNL